MAKVLRNIALCAAALVLFVGGAFFLMSRQSNGQLEQLFNESSEVDLDSLEGYSYGDKRFGTLVTDIKFDKVFDQKNMIVYRHNDDYLVFAQPEKAVDYKKSVRDDIFEFPELDETTYSFVNMLYNQGFLVEKTTMQETNGILLSIKRKDSTPYTSVDMSIEDDFGVDLTGYNETIFVANENSYCIYYFSKDSSLAIFR